MFSTAGLETSEVLGFASHSVPPPFALVALMAFELDKDAFAFTPALKLSRATSPFHT